MATNRAAETVCLELAMSSNGVPQQQGSESRSHAKDSEKESALAPNRTVDQGQKGCEEDDGP
jgi:hypothetical protein